MDTHVLANPKLAAILGGLVADAASLGLHWLYDPNQIAEIEKESDIAFRQPNENDYANVSGFFAHGSKVAGDSSGYGEICLLMLKHLAKHGQFNHMAYQLEFRAFFGPGENTRVMSILPHAKPYGLCCHWMPKVFQRLPEPMMIKCRP